MSQEILMQYRLEKEKNHVSRDIKTKAAFQFSPETLTRAAEVLRIGERLTAG